MSKLLLIITIIPIISGEVSHNMSYCNLRDFSTPYFSINNDVYYDCYLIDENGNEIDINNFISNSIYEFSCDIRRIKPYPKSNSITIENKGNFYSCYFKTSDPGVYEINGILTRKDQKSILI